MPEADIRVNLKASLETEIEKREHVLVEKIEALQKQADEIRAGIRTSGSRLHRLLEEQIRAEVELGIIQGGLAEKARMDIARERTVDHES